MKISKKELEKIYNEYSNKKAADILEISHSTLLALIKNAGIIQKGKGNRNSKRKIEVV